MEFGRVTDVSNVDFTLKETPDCSTDFLRERLSKSAPSFFIGGTGWSMPEWIGTWYPKSTRAAAYLHEYCKQFNTIECNTTFYQIPDQQTIARWRSVATSGFRFCPKIYQGISRSVDFGAKDQLLVRYWEAIQGLDPYLGPVFMQLPETYSSSKLNELCTFLLTCPDAMPLFLELRHPSWFVNFAQLSPLLELLKERQFGWVQTDVAGRRDVLHQHLTCDTAFIRFVACGDKKIDQNRLTAWAAKLSEWFSQGLSKVYFFVHDFDSANVPLLTSMMIEQMNASVGALDLQLPHNYERTKQLTLF